MAKVFNVTGDCKPKWHYMADFRVEMSFTAKEIMSGRMLSWIIMGSNL